ncbi:MAG TPA: hypothetical protein DIV86_01220 [Alphaproteobacteria bacterium]|nr:hypothetical protein [Alphaproteobacteria bacterium]
MFVTKKISEKGVTFYLSGRFGVGFYDRFRSVIDDIKTMQVKEIDINLSKLENIDSMAVGLILSAKEEAAKHGVSLVVSNPSAAIKPIIASHHFEKYIKIQDI